MTEQWNELKETIIEMRDNDGTGTQQEVCKFLANLMDVLEKQMQEPKTNIRECGSCKYSKDGHIAGTEECHLCMWESQYKPKTEWIPCSEMLPEEREWYLAIFKEKGTGYQLIPRVADYIGKGKNKWRVIDEEGLCQEYRDILECIAWMPLPEPFKGE